MAKMRSLTCPHCGLRLNIRQSSINSVIRCKGCGNKIQVRSGSGPGLFRGLMGCAALCVLLLACLIFAAIFNPKANDRSVPPGPEGPKNSDQAVSANRARQSADLDAERQAREAAAKAVHEEQEAKARELARRKTEREAAVQERKERFEKETEAYRVARAEYDAARMLKLARIFADDAWLEQARGHQAQADDLLAKAQGRYQAIVKEYRGTKAADDARRLLEGEKVAARPTPPLPTPPAPPALNEEEQAESEAPADATWVLVQGTEGELRRAGASEATLHVALEDGASRTVPVYGYRASERSPELTWILVKEPDARLLSGPSVQLSLGSAAAPGSRKPVFVHGFYRKNGTYVQSHWRAAPTGGSSSGKGNGGGRRR